MGALPYSYQQIKKELQKNGLCLEKLWLYKQKITKYDILDKSGNTLAHKLSLNQIRWLFTICNVPLQTSDQTKEENKHVTK